MVTIDRNSPVSENETHKFVAMASDLGLRAGEWPERIETTLGNSLPFVRGRAEIDNENELKFYMYYQSAGCISLKIYND